MAELVKTEMKKIHPFRKMRTRDKVIVSTVEIGAALGGTFGVPFLLAHDPSALIVITPLMLLMSAVAIEGSTRDSILAQTKDWPDMRHAGFGFFSLIGRKKTRSFVKDTIDGRAIEATVTIGRGKCKIEEAVTENPLHLWDDAVATLRKLYPFDTPNEIEQRNRKDKYGNLIEQYRSEIKKMDQDINCSHETIQAKRAELTKLKQIYYASH